MFCQKCGARNPENANNCTSCGQSLRPTSNPETPQGSFGNQVSPQGPYNRQMTPNQTIYSQQPNVQQGAYQQRHDVPRCTCCGYTGPWKLDSLFRPVDFVLGIIFLFLGVLPGIIYLTTVGIIRSNKDRRDKICPNCKAKNLWTFLY